MWQFWKGGTCLNLILTGWFLKKKLEDDKNWIRKSFFGGCCINQRERCRGLNRMMEIEAVRSDKLQIYFQSRANKILRWIKWYSSFCFVLSPKAIGKEGWDIVCRQTVRFSNKKKEAMLNLDIDTTSGNDKSESTMIALFLNMLVLRCWQIIKMKKRQESS